MDIFFRKQALEIRMEAYLDHIKRAEVNNVRDFWKEKYDEVREEYEDLSVMLQRGEHIG